MDSAAWMFALGGVSVLMTMIAGLTGPGLVRALFLTLGIAGLICCLGLYCTMRSEQSAQREAERRREEEQRGRSEATRTEIAELKTMMQEFVSASKPITIIPTAAEVQATARGTAIPTIKTPGVPLRELMRKVGDELQEWLDGRVRAAPPVSLEADDWEQQVHEYLDFVRETRDYYRARFEPQVRGIVDDLQAVHPVYAERLAQVYENPPGFAAMAQVVTELRGIVVTPEPATAVPSTQGPTVTIGERPKP